MEILKHAHSGLRWIFLLIIIFAIVNAIRKWKSGDKFGAKDKLISVLTLAFTHTQAMIGFILYFSEEKYKGFSEMGDRILRFYAVEHLLGMLIAVILITIGHSKAKKEEDDKAKFKKIFVWFSIALLIVLISIPWPFTIAGAGLY